MHLLCRKLLVLTHYKHRTPLFSSLVICQFPPSFQPAHRSKLWPSTCFFSTCSSFLTVANAAAWAVQHSQRKELSTFWHIHELTYAWDWLVLLWLTEETVFSQSPNERPFECRDSIERRLHYLWCNCDGKKCTKQLPVSLWLSYFKCLSSKQGVLGSKPSRARGEALLRQW